MGESLEVITLDCKIEGMSYFQRIEHYWNLRLLLLQVTVDSSSEMCITFNSRLVKYATLMPLCFDVTTSRPLVSFAT